MYRYKLLRRQVPFLRRSLIYVQCVHRFVDTSLLEEITHLQNSALFSGVHIRPQNPLILSFLLFKRA